MMSRSLCTIIFIFVMALVFTMNSANSQERPQVDPTRPPPAFLASERGDAERDATRVPRLRLQSIRYVEGTASAMINQEIYRVGDRLGAWQVIDISPSQVELQRDEELLTLTVFVQGQLTISKDPS
ncbi:MAG: MSH system periplasmic protein MshK [Idiomarinaceae bacterium HL-53]|nr:MAG: MSH system periplasmic protein MshK [Idiomarinaceae bacterium HL-53]CUS47469.1 hypothetical protein Ga0003345_0396 [Idiomarinaceae bacterium HL-53]